MEHHHLESVSSTNDWAKERLDAFSREQLTLVTSTIQTRGRGQYGRRWISPTSNLYASFCFFVDKDACDPLVLSHVMVLSLSALIEKRGIKTEIKWPNDVKVHGKKIAGILCETVPCADHVGVVLGLGMNVNMEQAELDAIDQPATSLLVEQGKQEHIAPIIEELKARFAEDLALYLKNGFEPFLPAFKQRILPRLNAQL